MVKSYIGHHFPGWANIARIERGQSTLIAFLLALLIIVLILIPTYYLILNYSVPEEKVSNFVLVAQNQLNGGNVNSSALLDIYYNASLNKGNVTIVVYTPNKNFTLSAVYVIYNGQIINITKEVEAIKQQSPKSLPQPLIYNFTIPSAINNIQVDKSILILQLELYNQTIFATLYPYEIAFS